MPRLSTLALFSVALVALLLPACNTIKGVGKDIHDAAQNVQTWLEQSDENRERLASNPQPSNQAYRNRY